MKALVVVAAFVLDLLLGDPEGYPHPVRLMGWATAGLEPRLRRLLPLRLAGAVLWVAIVGGSLVLTWALVELFRAVHPWAGTATEVFFLYTAIALKDLGREARAVYRALEAKDLPLARKRLSRIVSRDTEDLPSHEVVRGAVESVAENTVDGVLSPLLFGLVGGAPLAMAFKAASTLDSMVGYRDELYKDFGFFSAKMDDLLNFVPARLCIFLIPLAALFLGMDPKGSFMAILKDRCKTLSPNAWVPEAAFAGALGISLGGPVCYRGELLEVPRMGFGLKGREPADILRAIRLAYGTSCLFLLLALGLEVSL